MRRSNRRYRYQHQVQLIDLGLRLTDVHRYDLLAEPTTVSRKSRHRLCEYGATQDEIDFLCSGKRVELNALTSDQFIQWLTNKLTESGVKKVVPDSITINAAFERAVRLTYINQKLIEVQEEVEALTVSIPKKPAPSRRSDARTIAEHALGPSCCTDCRRSIQEQKDVT